MTDVSLELLNRRAIVSDVHAEAAKIGADGEKLLDSIEFHSKVTALDPDAPGYRRQMVEMVADAARRPEAAPRPPAAAPQQAQAGQQWDMERVNRSTAAELSAALDAGLLRSLGYAPRRATR
jgi:hypothetical protein